VEEAGLPDGFPGRAVRRSRHEAEAVLAILKRYRDLILVAVLLMLPLAAYLAYAKRGRDLTLLDRGVILLTSPLARAMTAAANGAVDAWGGYVALRAVREENLALRRENLRLREQVSRLTEQRQENDRLKKALGFSETAPTPVLVAPVVGEAPVMNLLTVKIGKGTRDGVQKGMAVASPEGVVGRVLSAAGGTADVLLVSDANFAVPVRVQRSRARAKVMGQGARARPVLVQALRTEDIEDGDFLVTAGTDGVFPKGLIVGRVTGLSRPRQGMFLSAEVNLSADPARLEEVMVILRLPGREDLPEAALPRR
jgi:rod shape-determining protein MreC